MISGYNTDVRHGSLVFHVQTEDKGLDNPVIESLVYVGGRVLAAKRAPYGDLLAQGKTLEEIAERMELQHRTIIAAIKQGRFDGKVEGLLGPRSTAPQPIAASATQNTPVAHAPTSLSATATGQQAPSPRLDDTAAALEPTEVEDFLAATRITESERTLDQVILEYLSSEAAQEQLLLSVEGEPALISGSASRVVLRATSSRSGQPVTGAQVDVKLISTVAEARTLASGATDDGGGVQLSFLIPNLGSGSSALIFTAQSGIGMAELKHLL